MSGFAPLLGDKRKSNPANPGVSVYEYTLAMSVRLLIKRALAECSLLGLSGRADRQTPLNLVANDPGSDMWHRSPIVVLRRAPAASPARRVPPAP